MSLKVVGCSTGMSAGLAPLRIFATKAADPRIWSARLTP